MTDGRRMQMKMQIFSLYGLIMASLLLIFRLSRLPLARQGLRSSRPDY